MLTHEDGVPLPRLWGQYQGFHRVALLIVTF